VDLGIEVRPLDAGGQLARHLERDPVAALGAVQGDPGDGAGHLVGQRLERFDPWIQSAR
jgi:hypothetical protein